MRGREDENESVRGLEVIMKGEEESQFRGMHACTRNYEQAIKQKNRLTKIQVIATA